MHTKNSEEIDLLSLIKKLWANKQLIIVITLTAVIAVFFLTKLLPKSYKAKVSFHINQSSPIGNLGGYASLLGVSNTSNIENIVKSLLKSNRIKVDIANDFEPEFKTIIQEEIQNENLKNTKRHITQFLISHLGLNTVALSRSEDNLITISYYSKEPQLAKRIVQAYIDKIEKFNTDLEISSDKRILTIIDESQVELYPSKPNLKKNIVLTGFLALFLSSIFILLKH